MHFAEIEQWYSASNKLQDKIQDIIKRYADNIINADDLPAFKKKIIEAIEKLNGKTLGVRAGNQRTTDCITNKL